MLGFVLGKALQYLVAMVLWAALFVVLLGLMWLIVTLARAIA